jgi:hypothetical protein
MERKLHAHGCGLREYRGLFRKVRRCRNGNLGGRAIPRPHGAHEAAVAALVGAALLELANGARGLTVGVGGEFGARGGRMRGVGMVGVVRRPHRANSSGVRRSVGLGVMFARPTELMASCAVILVVAVIGAHGEPCRVGDARHQPQQPRDSGENPAVALTTHVHAEAEGLTLPQVKCK